MEKRELATGVYNATERFKAITQHSCVCYKDDMGLVASTGPAGDKESQEYADLFAAAPEMKEALTMAPEPVDLEQGLEAVEEFICAYFDWYAQRRDTSLAKADNTTVAKLRYYNP